jgi:peptide/nickel transport system permease protein
MTPRRRSPAVALLTLTGAALVAPLLVDDRPILARRPDGALAWPALAERGWSDADGVALLNPPLHQSWRAVHLDESLRPPSLRHPFGTDALGRDLLARILHGARLSILVGLGATGLALGAGLLLGGTAALRGGWGDLLLSRVIETLTCFPPFVLAMAMVAVRGGGVGSMIVAIGVGRTASAARFARTEVLRWRGTGVWLAARASGGSRGRTALRHLLPLLADHLSIQAAFGVAQAILLEGGLSFLGLGVPAPVPSWGNILADGRSTLEVAWWPVVVPALGLAAVLAFLLRFGLSSPESVQRGAESGGAGNRPSAGW